MIREYGDRALLIECDSTAEVLARAEALRNTRPPGVIDIVPGARTVLVSLADTAGQSALRAHLSGLTTPERADSARPNAAETAVEVLSEMVSEVVVEVVYDGVDLPEVARLLDMTIADVVDAHTSSPWRVGFGGFSPGFAYLVDGDPRLHVPRRSEPRPRVPAGSVGLAGEFSGIYPRESPGGWQLIGRTGAVLWDIERTEPALLTPGMWVRFRAVPAT